MAKGQSTIIQYVLFFTIGISLFITLGSTFLSQYNAFGKDFASSNTMLANSFLSSQTVYLSSQCRQCQQISQSVAMQNVTRLFQSFLNKTGLTIRHPLANSSYSSTIHNLNYTLNFTDSFAPFARAINISINKDKNNLEIGGIK